MRLPAIITKHLAMPHGSHTSVVTAMLDIHAAVEAEEMHDPPGRIKEGPGAKAKVGDPTPQAGVVYQAMESGMSLGSTPVIMNQWRRAHLGPYPGVSYGALQRFAANSTVLMMAKRETRKAGPEEKESAKARAGGAARRRPGPGRQLLLKPSARSSTRSRLRRAMRSARRKKGALVHSRGGARQPAGRRAARGAAQLTLEVEPPTGVFAKSSHELFFGIH